MELREFIEVTNRSREKKDLSSSLLTMATHLGFNFFIFSNLSPTTIKEKNMNFDVFSNYPPSWLAQYKLKNYILEDPIYNATYRESKPFFWEEIQKRPMSKRAMIIMEEAKAYSLVNGISVPVHSAFGHIYELNFVSAHNTIRKDKSFISICNVIANQLVIAYNDINTQPNHAICFILTPREKEILQWIAVGKTKSEIAKIFSVSESCIKRHCEKIFLKLHVRNLPSAVAKSFHYGLID